MVSIDHPSLFRPPNVEDTTLQRLVLLLPALKRAMLSSCGNSQAEPLIDEEIRLLLTKTGVPIKWVYFSSKDGADWTYPGMGYPEGYHPHDQSWYKKARAPNRGLIWVEPYEDALGIGHVLSCSAPIYDYNDEFLGVVGFDLLESFVNGKILKGTDDPYVDAFLVNGEGKVLLQGDEDLPRGVGDKIKNRESHIRTDDKLVAYFPLHVSDWYYVVVADSDHIQEVLDSMQGQQNGSQ